MKKTLVALVLIMAICLCGACAPNDDNTAHLQEQITQMQQLIDSQQQQMDLLSNQVKDMSSANNEDIQSLKDKLKEQQEKMDLYKAQLRNLTGDPIIFEAKAPMYDFDIITEREEIVCFESFIDMTTPYKEYSEYIKKNRPFGNDKALVFKPDDYEYEGHGISCGSQKREYLLYKEDEKLMNFQFMEIYDPILTSENLYKYDFAPQYPFSIRLSILTPPINLKVPEKLSDIDYNSFFLIFGKTNEEEFYVNIYIENICIGTIYYATGSYISSIGFKDLLYNHLEFI